jgi:hypothetical protein
MAEALVEGLATFRKPEPRVPDPVASSNSMILTVLSFPVVTIEAGVASAKVTVLVPASWNFS